MNFAIIIGDICGFTCDLIVSEVSESFGDHNQFI